MNQNRQFEDVVRGLTDARDSLDGARCVIDFVQYSTLTKYARALDRLRNHDLFTSLDVLTTGSYRRLPTIIKVCPVQPELIPEYSKHS
jgi:mediator of RNA polymerase II transcription subunit 14